MSSRKLLVAFGVLIIVGAVVVAITLWIQQESQLPVPGFAHQGCKQFGIVFNDHALQRQFSHTEKIVEDPIEFWLEDRAHSLLATSPRINPDTLPPVEWLEQMEALVRLSKEERKAQEPYPAGGKIMDYRDSYCTLGIPIVLTLLPHDTDLSTTVHLAAFTDPRAFTAVSNIVMNSDVGKYYGKSSGFLNTLSHELFHIGYWRTQPHQLETWPESYPLKAAIVTLQNEGMATYSQELIGEFYPHPLEIDLFLSQRKLLVRLFVDRVNDLLATADSLPEDDAIRLIYSGITRQALYSVGAHMARTIEGELGRSALADTVAQGPRSFIQAYNELVEEGWKIVDVDVRATRNPFQQLRFLVIEQQYEPIPDLLTEIKATPHEDLNGAMFEEIRSAGLVLVERGEVDLGVSVFEVMTEIFSDHPYSHIYLAETYQAQGEQGLATECFDAALELDPTLYALIDQ